MTGFWKSRKTYYVVTDGGWRLFIGWNAHLLVIHIGPVILGVEW